MSRPVTLFTGQWADLPLTDLAKLAVEMGYEGLELACWGDHFEVDKAAVDEAYCKKIWDVLIENGLTCYSVSSHLVGQCICDPIDARHESILFSATDVWGKSGQLRIRMSATTFLD